MKRHPVIAIAVVGLLGLAIWLVASNTGGEPSGAACESNRACDSGICLPDADPAEVARLVEVTKAYKQGQEANPSLAAEIEELIKKAPRSSLTLRPVYPGACADRCASDPDCPPGMFCAQAVWLSAVKGIDRGELRICMPDDHPAARLVR